MGVFDFAKRWKDAFAARNEMAADVAAESSIPPEVPSWSETRAARASMAAEVKADSIRRHAEIEGEKNQKLDDMEIDATRASQPPRTPSEPRMQAVDVTPRSEQVSPPESIRTPIPRGLRPEEIKRNHEVAENLSNKVEAGGYTYDMRDLERANIAAVVPQEDWKEFTKSLELRRNELRDAHSADLETLYRASTLLAQVQAMPDLHQSAMDKDVNGVPLEPEEAKVLEGVRQKVTADIARRKEEAVKGHAPDPELAPDSGEVRSSGVTTRSASIGDNQPGGR